MADSVRRRGQGKLVLWPVALGLLGLLTWLVVEQPRTEPTTPSTAEAPPSLPADSSAPTGPSAPVGTDPVASPGPLQTPPDQGLPPPEALPTRVGESRGELVEVEVRVRWEESELPIPGAEILCIENFRGIEGELEHVIAKRGFDVAMLSGFGRRARADEQGIAKVACKVGDLLVLSFGESHQGFGDAILVSGRPEQVVVECGPASSLAVQVVDREDRPRQGILVRAQQADTRFLTLGAASAPTQGSQGIATLAPLAGTSGVWKIWIDGLFPAAEVVQVDLRESGPRPVRLVLQECGAVEVRFAYSDGTPYGGSAEVELECDEPTTEPMTEEMEIGSGFVRFPRVALGLQLRVVVATADQPRKFELAGPVREGETVVCPVPMDPARPTLRARVVDPEGRALRFHDLELVLTSEGPGSEADLSLSTTTDAVGRFAVTVELPLGEPLRAALLVRDDFDSRPLGAWREFKIAPRDNDLGTWTLTPPVLLAAGTTVDADGRPLGPRSVELVNPKRRLGLGFALPCQSDEQGRFELVGWCSEPTIHILAGVRGARLRLPIQIESGAVGVTLSLPAASQTQR